MKRLVCIEDLGDIDILITDKTGTLTEGHIALVDAVDPAGNHAESVLRLGMLATEVDPTTGGVCANELDAALWATGQALPVSDELRSCPSITPADRPRQSWMTRVDE